MLVERLESNSAARRFLEALGLCRASRIPTSPVDPLRLGGQEGGARRAREFQAHAFDKQRGDVLGGRRRWPARTQYWNEQLSRKVLEYRLQDDPAQEARAFVLPYVTLYDAGIACWEAKYTYWAIRPFQLDPELKAVVPTPNHPSYPAAHACASIAVTRVLGSCSRAMRRCSPCSANRRRSRVSGPAFIIAATSTPDASSRLVSPAR
jgi:hypothetical protein